MTQLLRLTITFALLLPMEAFGAGKINKSWLSNVAIDGYDSVAYHTVGQAVPGKKKWATKYQGASWYFASEENLKLFKSNPGQYAPQYGGYCAYAVAEGSTAGVDPKAFTLHEGKLYLNYSEGIEKKWRENKLEFIKNADVHWKKINH